MGSEDTRDPRRRYETRPNLGTLPGTTAPRLDTGPLAQRLDRGARSGRLQQPAPAAHAGPGSKAPLRGTTYEPLFMSSLRWHSRLWLMNTVMVLLVLGLLVFAYALVRVDFPQ
jgi:hypothetical protein